MVFEVEFVALTYRIYRFSNLFPNRMRKIAYWFTRSRRRISSVLSNQIKTKFVVKFVFLYKIFLTSISPDGLKYILPNRFNISLSNERVDEYFLLVDSTKAWTVWITITLKTNIISTNL